MALTPAQKEVADKIEAKITELNDYLRNSLPLRSTGGSHIFNELQKVIADVKKLDTL